MPKKTPVLSAGTSALVCLTTGENKAKSGAVAPKVIPVADAALPTGPCVTVAAAAELLRVCPKTVRNRIKSGELEAYRHGRRILIPLAAIDRLIQRGRIRWQS